MTVEKETSRKRSNSLDEGAEEIPLGVDHVRGML